MRCPTLAELPPPPPGKTGWPWTEECPQLPDAMPDGRPWPRISIVTPSFNQGEYIEETIRSILLQGYPDLEYIVMDGGSTDGAVDVIERYERWLASWRSQPDGAQTQAINAGLARASGELFHFINSDDVLEPEALKAVALAAKDADAVAGAVVHSGLGRRHEVRNRNLSVAGLVADQATFRQPGVFLRTDMLRTIDSFHADFQYAFDKRAFLEYLYYFSNVKYTKHCVVGFRYHEDTNTIAEP